MNNVIPNLLKPSGSTDMICQKYRNNKQGCCYNINVNNGKKPIVFPLQRISCWKM